MADENENTENEETQDEAPVEDAVEETVPEAEAEPVAEAEAEPVAEAEAGAEPVADELFQFWWRQAIDPQILGQRHGDLAIGSNHRFGH